MSRETSSKPALRKGLGQHHLASGALVRPLLDYLDLRPSVAGAASVRASAGAERKVFEIGPGGGVLTGELLRCGARVVAMELDTEWAFEVGRRLRHLEHGRYSNAATIVISDALQIDWRRFTADWEIVGNLPYAVATALLQGALSGVASGVRLVFLVQLEVAQRICARPGDRQYGALSVLVRARTGANASDARLLGRVKAGSFVPPPKVESAFVGLTMQDAPFALKEWDSFAEVVFAGFSQRRKTVRNALSSRFDKELVAEALGHAQISPSLRAEQLDVDVWVELWRHLRGSGRSRLSRSVRRRAGTA